MSQPQSPSSETVPGTAGGSARARRRRRPTHLLLSSATQRERERRKLGLLTSSVHVGGHSTKTKKTSEHESSAAMMLMTKSLTIGSGISSFVTSPNSPISPLVSPLGAGGSFSKMPRSRSYTSHLTASTAAAGTVSGASGSEWTDWDYTTTPLSHSQLPLFPGGEGGAGEPGTTGVDPSQMCSYADSDPVLRRLIEFGENYEAWIRPADGEESQLDEDDHNTTLPTARNNNNNVCRTSRYRRNCASPSLSSSSSSASPSPSSSDKSDVDSEYDSDLQYDSGVSQSSTELSILSGNRGIRSGSAYSSVLGTSTSSVTRDPSSTLKSTATQTSLEHDDDQDSSLPHESLVENKKRSISTQMTTNYIPVSNHHQQRTRTVSSSSSSAAAAPRPTRSSFGKTFAFSFGLFGVLLTMATLFLSHVSPTLEMSFVSDPPF